MSWYKTKYHTYQSTVIYFYLESCNVNYQWLGCGFLYIYEKFNDTENYLLISIIFGDIEKDFVNVSYSMKEDHSNNGLFSRLPLFQMDSCIF